MFNHLTQMNPVLHTDSYKVSHKFMEPKGTKKIYSNFTPRNNKYFKDIYHNHDGKAVFFGLQSYIIKELLNNWNIGFFKRPKKDVMEEITQFFFPFIGMDRSKLAHFEALHDLGYLPLIIKALPEGTLVPMNVPVLTITNTHSDFSWLPNYLESNISSELWKPINIATIAREFATLRNFYWDKTVSDHTFKEFAMHDFSYRGQDNNEASAINGAAALLYSNGTDNIPGLVLARTIYNADENTAFSVPASEHSVTTLGINYYKDIEVTGELKTLVDQLHNRLLVLSLLNEFDQAKGELITLYNLLTLEFPEGLLSYVADSYDFWRVLTILLPILKSTIMSRNGKLVIRPDSGDPFKIVCGDFYYKEISEDDHLQTVIEYFLEEDLAESTSHGEQGSNQNSGYFKQGNKYYYAEITNFSWNRHDKKYYYLDQYEEYNTEIKEITVDHTHKGAIEVLYEIFGGTVNDKGYKELDPHIGLIYGDGITFERATNIYKGLESKQFAASTVVFGLGSYSLANGSGALSRDSLSIAIKATYAEVEDKVIPIYKQPKTDNGKESAKGLLKVDYVDNELKLFMNVTSEEEKTGLLTTVFKDGQIVCETTFDQIKNRLKEQD